MKKRKRIAWKDLGIAYAFLYGWFVVFEPVFPGAKRILWPQLGAFGDETQPPPPPIFLAQLLPGNDDDNGPGSKTVSVNHGNTGGGKVRTPAATPGLRRRRHRRSRKILPGRKTKGRRHRRRGALPGRNFLFACRKYLRRVNPPRDPRTDYGISFNRMGRATSGRVVEVVVSGFSKVTL